MINININNPVICHLHVHPIAVIQQIVPLESPVDQLTISSTHFASSIYLYQAISYYCQMTIWLTAWWQHHFTYQLWLTLQCT